MFGISTESLLLRVILPVGISFYTFQALSYSIDVYRQKLDELSTEKLAEIDSHEEYSILDKARRVQLSEEVLKEAGIDSHKVKIKVQDGKIIISK